MSLDILEQKNKYKFELDGIRAIAIIAVLINHLNPDLIPSGFLGVDIFFTLSGFVISYSVSNKVFKNRTDFIKNFYLRRFKRLAPSLLIYVVFISILISLFIHSGGTYYLTGISSIFGLSNLFLIKINSGYWGDESLMNPFTNTWSLSIEEQFYFIFPFLIGCFIHKSKNKITFKNNYVYLITFISFLFYLFSYKDYAEISYYFTLTRVWQISLGIICFLFYDKFSINNKNYNFLSFISSILLVSILFINKEYSFFTHIAASVLTFFIILSLKNNNLIKKIFSNKLFRIISKISYQIYLWHWGIIVFARWTFGFNRYSTLFILLLTILISYLCHIFVEKPIRQSKLNWSYTKNFILLLIVSFIPFSLAKPLRNNFYIGELSGEEKIQNLSSSSRLIIYGDSHADDIWKILKNNDKYKLSRNVVTGCKYYQENSLNCTSQKRLNKKLFEYSQNKNNIIILASNLNPIVNNFSSKNGENYNKEELKKIKEFIIPLLQKSKSNIIFKLPHTSVFKPSLVKPIRCIKRTYRPVLDNRCFVKGTKKINYEIELKEFKEELLEIENQFSNFYLWDLTTVLCPDKLCYPTTKTAQFLHDESHLFYTSPSLNNEIIKSINQVLKKFEKSF